MWFNFINILTTTKSHVRQYYLRGNCKKKRTLGEFKKKDKASNIVCKNTQISTFIKDALNEHYIGNIIFQTLSQTRIRTHISTFELTDYFL